MNPKIGTSYASACDENLGDYFSRCFDLSDFLSIFQKMLFVVYVSLDRWLT